MCCRKRPGRIQNNWTLDSRLTSGNLSPDEVLEVPEHLGEQEITECDPETSIPPFLSLLSLLGDSELQVQRKSPAAQIITS
jgi:hypothetical protein